MTTFNKRMKHGLRWYDHNAPMPTALQVSAAVCAAFIVTLIIFGG
jgi:hypothetical protein